MRAVLLAGGTGSRLKPLTDLFSKHLLPVGRQPMIVHGIQKLKEAGIEDILVITGRKGAGLFIELLGSGRDLGVRLTYRIQEQASGIAEALLLAENYIRPGEKFVLLLGDNLFEESLAEQIRLFEEQPEGARILLKQMEDPVRYGVPVFQGNRIERIVEKPSVPPSSYCVTGIYFYDASVFDIARNLEPSPRNEFEITDVNNVYARKGLLSFGFLQGWWIDAGTIESLYEASRHMLRKKDGPGELDI